MDHKVRDLARIIERGAEVLGDAGEVQAAVGGVRSTIVVPRHVPSEHPA